MKEKNLPIVLFMCMGILFALMYGAFELGGCGMETWEKVIISIIMFGIIAFVGIAIWKTPISCKSANIYFDDDSLPPDAENVFILKENLISKGSKKIDADTVIYLGEECLRSFSISGNLKYIYFACAEPKIEKSFYENLVKKDVSINICNGSKLEIIDNTNTKSSIKFFPAKKKEVSNKIDVSGNINISIK